MSSIRFTFTTLFFVLFCLLAVNAQSELKLTDASKNVDVIIKVGECSNNPSGHCPAKFEFFRKYQNRPFQAIALDTTFSDPNDVRDIEFADFNFDGLEDVAISDGRNGGYVTGSYQVFLYSKEINRYVHSGAFTMLSQAPAMGLFQVDRKKRMLFRRWRTGCCDLRTEGYDVHYGRPRKVYELREDSSSAEQVWVHITTKKLINGQWRTWKKRAKISEYYK